MGYSLVFPRYIYLQEWTKRPGECYGKRSTSACRLLSRSYSAPGIPFRTLSDGKLPVTRKAPVFVCLCPRQEMVVRGSNPSASRDYNISRSVVLAIPLKNHPPIRYGYVLHLSGLVDGHPASDSLFSYRRNNPVRSQVGGRGEGDRIGISFRTGRSGRIRVGIFLSPRRLFEDRI